ncbi:hypothetical protein MTR_6g043360 [Medicago truncatula]|uniref:Uncharacterized protein n=1 Tax=Medicago truncatula TaxID=3880 RepID=A0A072UJN6_MEDTR|nr:hypothetical protein MTR_6g043360 [Medicago truncatula]
MSIGRKKRNTKGVLQDEKRHENESKIGQRGGNDYSFALENTPLKQEHFGLNVDNACGSSYHVQKEWNNKYKL